MEEQEVRKTPDEQQKKQSIKKGNWDIVYVLVRSAKKKKNETPYPIPMAQ